VIPTVLTIAGSDSGGGAGIQADLQAIAALQCHGATAITAVTSQNTLGVLDMHVMPATVVRSQIDAVMEDLRPRAVKTGMLASAVIVRAVAEAMERHGVKSLVVDPVLRSTSGAVLLDEEGQAELVRTLLPRARVVTPNLAEAEVLSGIPVSDLASMREAARILLKKGPEAVLVTGGHLEGPPVDLLVDGKGALELSSERVERHRPHGAGCALSAALAAGLARGLSVREAARAAKDLVVRAMEVTGPVGEGLAPVRPLGAALHDAERRAVLGSLVEAMALLSGRGAPALLPEVRSNLVYALPRASSHEEVAGFPGRLLELSGHIASVAPPAFSASRHIASVVLSAMRIDPGCRACLNIRYTDDVEERARARGLTTATFDRKDEPTGVRTREGSSLEWGTSRALEGRTTVPDLVHDPGGFGKEAMTRVLGRTPQEVVEKALRLFE